MSRNSAVRPLGGDREPDQLHKMWHKIPLCHRELYHTRRGLVTDISIVCHGWHNSTKFSDPYSAEAAKLNCSSVFAMRFAGGGLHSLERFCGLMSLPPPVTDNSYREHQAAITAAAMK